MNDTNKHESDLGKEVGKKESRKIQGRKNKKRESVWFGLGMFGLVGWSVAIPTIIFTAIGVWLDSITEGQISWTITFLFLGVILGCLNAWRWVKKESSNE